MGRIEVITGPMFAGKSTLLAKKIKNRDRDNMLAFKPRKNSMERKQKHINNRNGDSIKAIGIISSNDIYSEIYKRDKVMEPNKSLIVIDEAQFLDPGLIGVCDDLADKGYKVIVSGLDRMHDGSPFGPMPGLFSIAEEVTKLTAECEVCGSKATRSQYIVNGKPAPYARDIIRADDDESWEARCRECHVIEDNNQKSLSDAVFGGESK